MAEHNLFLGTAVRSVGDVTLFRRQGKQISRVRIRNIANPRSEAQSETRNFLSPVIKFYGALHTTLERSFQGKSKAASYSEFQRINIRLARQKGWYLTKGTGFYPMPYQLSQGTLPACSYSIDAAVGTYSLNIASPTRPTLISTVGHVSQVFTSAGYKQGDVVTIIVCILNEDGTYRPAVGQFSINTASAIPASTIGGSDFSFSLASGSTYVSSGDLDILAGAVIVSRYSKGDWLRSTQFLACSDVITSVITSAVQRAAAIESFSNPEGSGEGDSYLDGDGTAYNVATISGRALLFYGGQYNASVSSVDQSKIIRLKPANVNDLFYARDENGYYLGTNAAGSLTPSDWRKVIVAPSDATDANTILLATGTTFYQYLQSLGYSGA